MMDSEQSKHKLNNPLKSQKIFLGPGLHSLTLYLMDIKKVKLKKTASTEKQVELHRHYIVQMYKIGT